MYNVCTYMFPSFGKTKKNCGILRFKKKKEDIKKQMCKMRADRYNSECISQNV